MKNTILFTGLPRMESRFKQSVSEMSELSHIGIVDEIIFVTWKGRLKNKTELENYLLDNNIKIIKTNESPVSGHRNIWHQMKSLDIGLREVSSDHYVLRTRSDVYICPEFLKDLFTGEVGEITRPAKSNTFDHRIWAPKFYADIPFGIFDYCYYGHVQDLKRLVNYDARFDVLWETPSCHIRLYIHPYLDQYPILKKYLSYYSLHPPKFYEDNQAFMKKRLTSKIFGNLLGFYYKVLTGDFYINYDPVHFKNDVERPFQKLDYSNFLSNFLDYNKEPLRKIPCYDSDWIVSQFNQSANNGIPSAITEGQRRSFSEWRRLEISDRSMKKEAGEFQELVLSERGDNKISLFYELKSTFLD